MKILTEGHKYSLSNFEEDGNEQTIQFIEKIKGKNDDDDLITVNNGTTNEEILKMLINRLQFLYYKFPSQETMRAIQYAEFSLNELERRTKDRKERKVEGKHLL